MRMVVLWMVDALADRERHEDHHLGLDEFVEELVTALAAVMQAPG
jgi:hypothetical protein